jgi:hypothetical protein
MLSRKESFFHRKRSNERPKASNSLLENNRLWRNGSSADEIITELNEQLDLAIQSWDPECSHQVSPPNKSREAQNQSHSTVPIAYQEAISMVPESAKPFRFQSPSTWWLAPNLHEVLAAHEQTQLTVSATMTRDNRLFALSRSGESHVNTAASPPSKLPPIYAEKEHIRPESPVIPAMFRDSLPKQAATKPVKTHSRIQGLDSKIPHLSLGQAFEEAQKCNIGGDFRYPNEEVDNGYRCR